jgi:LmbE family N-acetylglucosaminyl deacetylase
MDDAAAPLEHVDEDWERALVVVAHPDDIEYGMAMAVAKWTAAGKAVTYLLATRGEAGIDGMEPEEAGPLREVEERASAEVVGVSVVEFLDHTDGIVEYGLPLRREIAAAIRRHRPDIVLTMNHELTFGGEFLNMADHRNVGLATLDAARDAGNRWIFADLLDDGLEPWNDVRFVAIAATGTPTHGVDVGGYLDAGVASLECHRAYIDGLGQDFDPRSFLEGHAREMGERLGVDLAIAFQVIGV